MEFSYTKNKNSQKTGQEFKKNLHSFYSWASTASTASSFDFAGAIPPNLATYIQSGIALHPNDYSEIEVEAQSSGFYVLQLRSTRYDNLVHNNAKIFTGLKKKLEKEALFSLHFSIKINSQSRLPGETRWLWNSDRGGSKKFILGPQGMIISQ